MEKRLHLNQVSLSLPAGCMIGLIGPDGVGKSSLLALLSGRKLYSKVALKVLGGDIADKQHRTRVCPHIAYMPQGLGKTSIKHYRLKRIYSLWHVCLDMMPSSDANGLMI